jgi:thiamine transporter
MNWYLITNILAGLGCLLFLIGCLAFEKFTWKKISIKHIVITAMLIAINVLLTNLLSYNLPSFTGGASVALGDWILFLLGAMFGPLVGFIGAVCTDSLGSIVNVGGMYHAGFMFDKVMLAFMGAMVFVFKKNKWLILKIVILYMIPLALESFIFNSIWLYSMGWGNAVFVNMIVKLIKYPIVLIIYTTLVTTSLLALNPLLVRWQTNTDVWCLKHGLIWEFKNKKSNMEKISQSIGENSYE